jgi:hypothetical protein
MDALLAVFADSEPLSNAADNLLRLAVGAAISSARY